MVPNSIQHIIIGDQMKIMKQELQKAVNKSAATDGIIYFVWYFKHLGKDNEHLPIETSENSPFVRVALVEWKKKHSGHFFYSNRIEDLQIDHKDPTSRPKLGPYAPPIENPEPLRVMTKR